MATADKLFVAGPGRSGTGALARLLSEHPEIAIGLERFKYLQDDPEFRLTADHFTHERFFDFGDGGTNVNPDLDGRWREYYEKLEDKWDRVRYVGDKMTVLRFRPIWETMPEARFVCIVRNIRAVAASWSARAADPDDVHWPDDRDAHAAVETWNRNLFRLTGAKGRRPHHITVVEHERLFGDPEARLLRRVIDWLDLEWTPDYQAAFQRSHEHFVGYVEKKDRTLTPADEAFIAEHADLDRWQSVLDELG